MFSFTVGTPVAFIDGGKADGKIIKVVSGDLKAPSDKELIELIHEPLMKKFDWVIDRDIKEVAKCLRIGTPPLAQFLREVFDYSKLLIDDKKLGSVVISDVGKFHPALDAHNPQRIYIAGPSSAGKSFHAGKYMRVYNVQFPENKIYIISRVGSDSAFEDVENIERIEVDAKMLDDPISKADFSDCMVVFDDIDQLENRKLEDYVRGLRNALLETGRHENIYIICTSHLICDNKRTKTMINEANIVVFFPQAGCSGAIERLLKEYSGVTTRAYNYIKSIQSRWIEFHKHYPQFIMSEKSLIMLNTLN